MAAASRVAELEARLSKYERFVESMFGPEPDEERYKILELIRAGSFGQVRKARIKSSGELAVIKAVRFDPQPEGIATLIRGIKNILSVRPETNIVQYFDIFRGSQDTINYVLEFCDCDLEQFMQLKQNTSLKNLFSIALQTLRGTYMLHSNSPPIIHGNIKPTNALLQTKPNSIVVKLCDFGISSRSCVSDRFSFDPLGKDGAQNPQLVLNVLADHGLLQFLGPEFHAALDGQGLKDGGKMVFDSSVDIYALGLVFAYMFCYDTSAYGS